MKFGWISLVVLFAYPVAAQVQSPGRFRPDSFEESRNLQDSKSIFKVPKLKNDLLSLMAESDDTGPYKFGEAMPITIDMTTGDGEWAEETMNGVRKWRALIQSDGAKSISILFSDFYLPSDAEFYVIGEQYVIGAYTGAVNNKSDGKFAIQPVIGQAVMLEYIEPLDRVDSEDKPRIKVSKAVHGFRSMQAGESGACNIDVKCPLGAKWKKQIDAVAVMLTDQGQRYCSGAMINNTAQDGAQYFLTADHCVYKDDSFLILGFNYQYSACQSGGQKATLQMPQTVQGLTLVARHENSDFALFLVKEKIPDHYNVYLTGWDNRKIAPKNVVGIHHPSGDVKKISTYGKITKPAAWKEGNMHSHWKIPYWLYGTTEQGSSGSPLYNDKGLLVGQLHGGNSNCAFKTGYDMYGAFWADWTAITDNITSSVSSFLNPTGQPIQAIPGKYLKEIQNRRVPQVISIISLNESSQPHLTGSCNDKIDTIQTEISLNKYMIEADLINDLLDDESPEMKTLQNIGEPFGQNQKHAYPIVRCRIEPPILK